MRTSIYDNPQDYNREAYSNIQKIHEELDEEFSSPERDNERIRKLYEREAWQAMLLASSLRKPYGNPYGY